VKRRKGKSTNTDGSCLDIIMKWHSCSRLTYREGTFMKLKYARQSPLRYHKIETQTAIDSFLQFIRTLNDNHSSTTVNNVSRCSSL